jgi:hypothetical protein
MAAAIFLLIERFYSELLFLQKKYFENFIRFVDLVVFL